MKRTGLLWFAAFTAVFAALAAFVFWGCWSPDVAFVAPDDAMVHRNEFAAVWDDVIRTFWTTGRFIPSDILGRGLLGSPDFCQELKYVAALYFSGLGMAYFLRGRGLSRLAAYGAGLLLAFCGYWSTLFSAGHYGWFIWMTYGVFAFGLADRAVRFGRPLHWALLGATVAWGSFQQPDIWLLFTVFTGFYFVWCCVRERKIPWKGALIAAGFLLAIGAPSFHGAIFDALKNRDQQIAEGQTVVANPGAKDGKAAKDETDTRWIFITNWSLPPEESAEFFRARVNGDTSCMLTRTIGNANGSDVKPYTGALGRPLGAKEGNYRQHSLYVGWVTCLLALLGIALWAVGLVRRREAGDKSGDARQATGDIVFFAVAALVFWIFSMGRYCEFAYRLIYALPFGDYMRGPVKWHHLTEFCLVALAGFGVEFLWRFLRERGCGEKIAFTLVALLVVFGAVNLARNDRLYCAPVPIQMAREKNCDLQLTGIPQQPGTPPLVRNRAYPVPNGWIVPIAKFPRQTNDPRVPDFHLIEYLQKRKPYVSHPLPPMTRVTGLGFLSLAGLCALVVWALVPWIRRRRGDVRG